MRRSEIWEKARSYDTQLFGFLYDTTREGWKWKMRKELKRMSRLTYYPSIVDPHYQ